MRRADSLVQRAAWWMFVVAACGVFSLATGQCATAQEKKEKGKAKAGELKFEIYQDGSMEYRWRLKAANGKVLGTGGQGYKAKADAKHGVERIKNGAASLTFEIYDDKSKEHRWRVKASNGQVIATSSQGYKDKADCEHAIEVIKKGAAHAEVVEEVKEKGKK
jgi:uncharacterized protein YegP (UPF0339 family)